VATCSTAPVDYLWAVDREAIARGVRRRQVQETLDFERDREQTLMEQVELVIGEADGSRVDEAAFEKMSPEDVQIVKEELDPPGYDAGEGTGFFERDDLFDLDEFEEVDAHAEELARLNEELEQCRRRQQAFSAYLDALGE
jgi:hypothetical protein